MGNQDQGRRRVGVFIQINKGLGQGFGRSLKGRVLEIMHPAGHHPAAAHLQKGQDVWLSSASCKAQTSKSPPSALATRWRSKVRSRAASRSRKAAASS